MRVIHILDHSIPLRSRYALRTLAILEEQRARGWETFHITGPNQGPAGGEENVDGWNFYRTPPVGGILDGVPVLGEIELMGEIGYRIEQVAKRVRPHILHAHSPVLNAIPALRVGRRLGIPVVYEARSLWADSTLHPADVRRNNWSYRLRRWVETWVLNRVDAIITTREDLCVAIFARGVRAGKVTVIPDFEDVQHAAAHGAPVVDAGRAWNANVARYDEIYARVMHEPQRT